MWTSSLLLSLVLVIRSLPMVLVRALAYGAVAAISVAFAALGAWIGDALDPSASALGVGRGAFLGALAGFALAAGGVALQWDRILSLVHAPTLAVICDGLARHRVPFLRGQIGHANAAVAHRFGPRKKLSALYRLIRGVVRRVPTVAGREGYGFGALLSGGLVSQVILANAYLTRPENAWEAAHDALVLFTQNARAIILAAGWIALVGWGVTGVVCLALVAPLSGLTALWPAGFAAGVYLLAAVGAWAVRATVIVPVSEACLLQVFLNTTLGQDPSPEWRGRLTQVCDRFRMLGDRALSPAPDSVAQA